MARDEHLLLLEFKRPVWLSHGLEDFRVSLQQLVVNLPEACNILFAPGLCAAIIADVEGQNITRKSVTVKVHGDRNFRACQTDVFSPDRDHLLTSISDVACNIIRIGVRRIAGLNILKVWLA